MNDKETTSSRQHKDSNSSQAGLNKSCFCCTCSQVVQSDGRHYTHDSLRNLQRTISQRCDTLRIKATVLQLDAPLWTGCDSDTYCHKEATTVTVQKVYCSYFNHLLQRQRHRVTVKKHQVSTEGLTHEVMSKQSFITVLKRTAHFY